MTADESDLPEEVVEEAAALARRERAADPPERQARFRRHREALLGEYDYADRIRSDGERTVLVLYPDEWVVGDTVRPSRIDDLERAIEVPLEGEDREEDWSTVDHANRRLAERIRREHGEIHGSNAAALADFMGNHHLKRIEDARTEEIEEFRREYFIRNAWPTEEQRDRLARSLELVREAVDARWSIDRDVDAHG